MMTIYLAGPLFTEAEAAQRIQEGKMIRKALDGKMLDYQLISPLEMPCNEHKTVTSAEIFELDYHFQCLADAVFFDLANTDTGSHMALGILLEKKLQGKPIMLYPVYSDSRLKRNQAFGIECPIGFNSFVIGGLKANGISIYDSFQEALERFLQDIENGRVQ